MPTIEEPYHAYLISQYGYEEKHYSICYLYFVWNYQAWWKKDNRNSSTPPPTFENAMFLIDNKMIGRHINMRIT